MSQTKQRKNNIPLQQIIRLLSFVKENHAILDSQYTGANAVTKTRKKELWQRISDEMSAMDPLFEPRTPLELRKKWNDMRQSVVRYKTAIRGTGGGPPPKQPPFYDEIMDIIADKRALIDGVPGINKIPSLGWGSDNNEPFSIILDGLFPENQAERYEPTTSSPISQQSLPPITPLESLPPLTPPNQSLPPLTPPNQSLPPLTLPTQSLPLTSPNQSVPSLQAASSASALIAASSSATKTLPPVGRKMALLRRAAMKRRKSAAKDEEQEAWLAYLHAKTEESRAKLKVLNLKAELIAKQLNSH